MLGDAEGAEVRYQEETMLLIAAGNQRQLEAIHEVLSELQSSLPPMLGQPYYSGGRSSVSPPAPGPDAQEEPAVDEGKEGGDAEEDAAPEPEAPGRRRSR
jgi:hypothetical protein